MRLVLCTAAEPDVTRTADIEIADGEVSHQDVVDEIDCPTVRTFLNYTPADAIRVGQALIAAGRRAQAAGLAVLVEIG